MKEVKLKEIKIEEIGNAFHNNVKKIRGNFYDFLILIDNNKSEEIKNNEKFNDNFNKDNNSININIIKDLWNNTKNILSYIHHCLSLFNNKNIFFKINTFNYHYISIKKNIYIINDLYILIYKNLINFDNNFLKELVEFAKRERNVLKYKKKK